MGRYRDLYILKYDKKPKGLFSYQFLRLVGFAFIAFSQLGIMWIILNLVALLDAYDLSVLLDFDYSSTFNLIQLSNIGKPIIICSFFPLILNKTKKLKFWVLGTLVLAIAFYFGEILVFNRLLLPFAQAVIAEYGFDTSYVELLYPVFLTYSSSFSNLNIFLDMFLCISLYALLWYVPKNIKPKNLKFYRLLAILPGLYIVASFVLSYLQQNKILEFDSVYIGSLLVHGSLPTFILFIASILFMRINRRRYNAYNHIDIELEDYLKTSTYSFSYTLFLLALTYCLSLFQYLMSFSDIGTKLPFETNFYLCYALPFFAVFNINRTPKFPKLLGGLTFCWMGFHYMLFVFSILLFAFSSLEALRLFL